MKTLSYIGRVVLIVGFVAISGAISQAELAITEGASDYQVFQRSENNKATVRVIGTSSGEGVIQARLLEGRKTLRGFAWKEAGSVQSGRWEARIRDIPVGGPYTLQFRLDKQKSQVLSIRETLVGDLWILAGQSNMQGVGDLIEVEEPSPLVHTYEYAERWAIAVEPLHHLLESIDSVHWSGKTDEGERKKAAAEWRVQTTKGAGLGLPFAKEMVERTGIPVGLVPCAHGGTSMEQWSPDKKDMGGGSLYGSMLRRFHAVGGRVKGVLWYQGESDANEKAAPLFEDRFKSFVEAVRRDFYDPDLPFYYVQIGRFVRQPGESLPWNHVQDAQRRLADEIPHSGVAASIDFELDDLIHVGTQSLKRLGRRLANLACRDLFSETDLLPGPSHPVAQYKKNRGHQIRVSFENVNGCLTAPGRVSGFSVRDQQAKDLMLIYDVNIDENQPTAVLLDITGEPPAGAVLWYGWGLDPYCNLVDEKDMAVPVFGPTEIKR
jgi:sialate O-acetylesterase